MSLGNNWLIREEIKNLKVLGKANASGPKTVGQIRLKKT